MHGDGMPLMLRGFFAVLPVMASWRSDVIREAALHGHHTAVVRLGFLPAIALFIGTALLAVCLWWAWQGHFRPDRHFGLDAAAWYWHFVDVVWLFLFVCFYWWGMGAAQPLGE